MGFRKMSWVAALCVLAACGDGATGKRDGGAAAQGDLTPDAGRGGVLEEGGVEPVDGAIDAGEDAGGRGPLGAPVGKAVSASVGPRGGSLRSSDGRLRLEIPAGALQDTQTISIQEVTSTAPQHTGKAFRLGPEGTRFAKPISLSFHYDDADVAGSHPALLRVAYQDSAGVWHMHKTATLEPDAELVRVATTHFSDWSLILGAQLLPLEAEVNVGKSLDLRVVACLKTHEESEDLVSIEYGYDCESDPDISAISYGWEVNGVLGGDQVAGGIVADDDARTGRAVFKAPAKKPAQNPVAVSVTVHDYLTPLFGTQTLVSNLKIIDDSAHWTGTITYEAAGEHTFEGQDGFVGSETDTYRHRTTFTVTGVAERNGPSTTLTLQQNTDIDYEKDGSMRKEVYEICQAGGPVILRDLREYSIASWLKGVVDQAVTGTVYVGADGAYSIDVDAAYAELAGQEVIVDKDTDGCSGGVDDNSGTNALHSSEGVGAESFEGKLDPDRPSVLSGGFERTLSDVYATKVKVSWNLQRSAE